VRAASLTIACCLLGCSLVVGCAPTTSPADAGALPVAAQLDTSTSPTPTTVADASPTPVTSAGAAEPSGTPSPTLSSTPEPSVPAPLTVPVGSFVLGDSISLSVAPALSRLGYPVTGRVGQSASDEYLRAQLSSPTAQDAPAWVIVLGTNNRGDETDLERLDDWLRTIRAARSGKPRQPVFWVTPHRPEEYSGGMSTHTLDAFNEALREEARLRPWLHVLDFATLAEQNPQWYAADGARLHPDEEGQQALVTLIAGADAPFTTSPAPITEIPRPTPKPSNDATSDQSRPEPEFTDMEFTNG
jgi:hypothetical protein